MLLGNEREWAEDRKRRRLDYTGKFKWRCIKKVEIVVPVGQGHLPEMTKSRSYVNMSEYV